MRDGAPEPTTAQVNPQSPVIAAIDHLVGNLYFNLSTVALVAGQLHPDSLPNCPGKHVYAEMVRLYADKQKRLSAGALEGALRSINFDFSYLSKLQSRVVPESFDAVEEYVKTISNWATLQKIKAEMIAALNEIESPSASAESVIPQIMRKISAVGSSVSKSSTIRFLDQVMDDVISDLESWKLGDTADGLLTGFTELDRYYRLSPGELTLISARPSQGKTALAMNIAENVARRYGDGCVLVFSAEMTDKSLGHRMAAGMAGVNGQRLRMGGADAGEYEEVITAARALKGLPIGIDDNSVITTDQMHYRAAMLNASRKVNLIIFDFVELGADPAKRDNEEQRISAIAKGLKSIAKDLNIPVIALSQLNRAPESRADKIPQLGDLRYSGMLEQIADGVLFIMRPEYYLSRQQSCFLDEDAGSTMQPDIHPHAKGVAYLFIAKQRNGANLRVNLSFISKNTKFGNLAESRNERVPLNY